MEAQTPKQNVAIWGNNGDIFEANIFRFDDLAPAFQDW